MLVSEIAAMVLKGSTELGTTLINAYAKRAVETNPEKLKLLKSNITPHIDSTFLKCSVIKTLLNPHRPANFLSIYATQRFHISDEKLDHYGLVDYIKESESNIILTGTGGSGKSMFTRYLWLSLFIDGAGRIPLFIEMRNINGISMDSIFAYIHYSISQGQASLTEKDYREHLHKGDFTIILDGFDELLQEKKDSIQNQIIQLTENYPKTRIIVTSRPDTGFSSWPSFEVASVSPLERNDVMELIEKSEFDDESKSLFLKRLRGTNLFQRHHSFLTNPLLASMMLLTFSHNFDIPDRMHLFYQQAFDALYQRHDSYKAGGFKRQFKTKLSEDVFKRTISYFCLITYYEEVFTFTRDEAIEALKKAINLAEAKADAPDLLDDLNGCVCFLIVDGLQYIFSHRSFQEYFAASCMAHVSSDKFESLISKFSKRPNDQVITLLADMNPEALRRLYILPVSDRFSDKIQLSSRIKSVSLFHEYTKMVFCISPPKIVPRTRGTGQLKSAVRASITLIGDGEFYDFVRLVEHLYRKGRSPVLSIRRTRAE
ncbi:MAG: NACHT domain-containing protein [Aliidongia sp.]